jgi:putative transcriptional regulator
VVESLQGHLLISGPGLVDPNFRRTIVLIGEHTDDGALGVVLNRPAPITVAETVPPLAELVPREERLFVGGPVQPQAAVVLADFDDPQNSGLLVMGSIGFLLGEVEPSALGAIRRARVFAGYAGWGPGQLEQELEESAWLTQLALPDDVFTEDPESLWAIVVKRKGGRTALMATLPLDPSTN